MTELHQSNLRREQVSQPSTWSSSRVAAGIVASVAIAAFAGYVSVANAQSSPAKPAVGAPLQPVQTPAAKTAPETKEESKTSTVPVSPAPDRSTAYYHAALADNYEDMATNYGRQEFFDRAVEEYKLAINADPASAELAIGLANVYVRAGRVAEGIQTAKSLIKRDDNNVDAHKLLGRIYLRSLGQETGPGSQPGPGNEVLDQAIAEFVKIVALEPKSVEDRLLLGQLYTVKHDNPKAEAQFKAAQTIEPASEDVVLNLARLYAESGDVKRSAELIEAVPVEDRTPKEEFALGAAYEQLKNMKDAIAAYQRSVDMEPENLDAEKRAGPGAPRRQPARRRPEAIPATFSGRS